MSWYNRLFPLSPRVLQKTKSFLIALLTEKLFFFFCKISLFSMCFLILSKLPSSYEYLTKPQYTKEVRKLVSDYQKSATKHNRLTVTVLIRCERQIKKGTPSQNKHKIIQTHYYFARDLPMMKKFFYRLCSKNKPVIS